MNKIPEEVEQDNEFITEVIFKIVNYARDNGMDEDETLKAIADWIYALLEIATFRKQEEKAENEN